MPDTGYRTSQAGSPPKRYLPETHRVPAVISLASKGSPARCGPARGGSGQPGSRAGRRVTAWSLRAQKPSRGRTPSETEIGPRRMGREARLCGRQGARRDGAGTLPGAEHDRQVSRPSGPSSQFQGGCPGKDAIFQCFARFDVGWQIPLAFPTGVRRNYRRNQPWPSAGMISKTRRCCGSNGRFHRSFCRPPKTLTAGWRS